jgi:hypothetical protein
VAEIYRDGAVHVRAEACDHCLFSADRLVPGALAREIVASTRAETGSSFICHRNQVSDEHEAICATWWESFADEDWMLRLAKATGIVKRI